MVLGVSAAAGAYVAAGALLDAVGNAITLVNWGVTIAGTILVILLWIGSRVVLKRRAVQWGVYRVKRLGYYPACAFCGVLLLLWTPPILRSIRDSPSGKPSKSVNAKTKAAKVVVLVSEFAGPDSQAYGVTEIIMSQLINAVKNYPDVRVIPFKGFIDSNETARARGKDEQADIVLWGSYLVNKTKTRVTVHFETMYKPLVLPSFRTKETLIASTTSLESFAIQEDLSQQMSFLVLLAIGLIRVEVDDFRGAIETFTRALTLSEVPQVIVVSHHIYDYRALCYLMLDMYKEALSDLTIAIQHEADPELLLKRGQVFFLLGETDKALADLNRSIKLDDKDERAYVRRSIVYSKLEDLVNALMDANKAVELDPSAPESLLNRADVFIRQAKFDSAIAEAKSILALCDAESTNSYFETSATVCPDDFPIWTAYYERGLALEGKGDSENALAAYSLAIDEDPGISSPYLKRSLILRTAGQFNDAIKDLDLAISKDPKDDYGYALRGEAYYQAKDLTKALADFTTAIKMSNGNSSVALIGRGMIYADMGQLKEAIADYNLAINISNDALPFELRCNAHNRALEENLAIRDCTKAIARDPKRLQPFIYRAAAYINKGMFTEALGDFDEATKLNPNESSIYFGRGLVYERLKNNDRAIAEYKKFLELGATHSSVTLGSGQTDGTESSVRQRLCRLGAGYCQ